MPMVINDESYELDFIDHDTTSELLFLESAEWTVHRFQE